MDDFSFDSYFLFDKEKLRNTNLIREVTKYYCWKYLPLLFIKLTDSPFPPQ